jgi:photosystem II stability/assembly factor-like uncharacterized protein/tetratricopeptide (TPR) repeat protein
MDEIINPYIAGAPVTEQRMFFGREDVFKWIETSLSGQYADHILVVHGQRRVGKTSVLKQLGNRLPEKYIPVFFDLQGRTHTTLDRFLWWLAREIVRVLKQERGIEVPVPEKEAFTSDPEYFETKFLTGLRPMLGENSLLLTFDEFDNLEEGEVKEELARPLIDYLRRMMGEAGLNFIFSIGSSGRKLENMQASYTEFFKTALYKKISFLSREQTTHLITKPVEGVLEYERAAVGIIFDTTFGHPYFTQLMCHELFARCQRTEQRRVAKSDVEAILEDVVERGTVNLKFVWDEASDIEKWSLTALAHMEARSDNRLVADYLRKNRVRFSETDMTSGLLHLREKDVLTTENQFVIGLLRLWLQKNRPVEQAREELTEVNPIANRYIEIGLEFKDSHLYAKAIESFQEALSVAKENVQAQVNIALVYMDQKAYDKAVVEFEKALLMDDEDVSARAGLCEAHLALGDSALGRGRTKEAVISYGRVLGINTEHTEARQRMAEISRQRAEKALTDGKDEEALSAFTEALKFTPEDEALAKRFDEAKKDRQEKVLSTLLARAEKEITAKNWDSAIGILQEGLHLSKDDERFKGKIAKAKEKQRAARLESILARAAQAESTGKWDAAITSLEEYLSFETGQIQIQERLEHARVKLREIQLREIRERARGFARSERWDESLAAWEEFLKQEPSDEVAQREKQEVEKSRALALSYTEAQKALTKKNYDKAITLFKGIVMEDADYKDATRRMAEAVELRRTTHKWWQSRWIWGSLTGLIVLAIGWFAFRPGSPLMNVLLTSLTGSPTAATQANTPLPTLAAATSPPTATAMFTPVPFAWKRLNSGQFLQRDLINVIVIDPTDAGVMYAGTANAGIYKSIDGGISWGPIHNGLGKAEISTLIVDPNDPKTLYAGTILGGVYKTSDGGQVWQAMNNGMDISGNEWLAIVAIDYQNSNHLYFTHSGSLYETMNGGETWHVSSTTGCMVGLAVDPSNGSVLYTARGCFDDRGGGIYKSNDNGRTWTIIGFDSQQPDFLSLWIDPNDGQTLYTSVDGNLWVTHDGGETWVDTGQGGCKKIVFDTVNSSITYCIDDQDKRLKITNNGGVKWNMVIELNIGGLNTLAVSPQDNSTLFLGTWGLSVSNDAGKTWEMRGSGLGGRRIDLYLDPYHASILYAQDTDCGLYRSSDGGLSWESMTNQGCGLAFDADGTTMYRAGEGMLWMSPDQGKTWELISFTGYTTAQADPVEGIHTIYSHPTISGRLYAVCRGSVPSCVFISYDNGKTWSKSTGINKLTESGLFFGDDSGQRIYVVSGDWQNYISDDSGQNWTECSTEAIHAKSPSSRLAIDPTNPKHVFLATLGRGVLESEDGCSWRESSTGLGSMFINAITIDPNNPDTLYAGTDGGAYVSFDGGETWGEINNGLLGATVVYSIVVDKDSNVYAATPYGIFILEGK